MLEQVLESIRQGHRIAGGDKVAGDAVHDLGRDPPPAGGYDGQAVRHRLQHHERERLRLVEGREAEHVGRGQGAILPVALDRTEQLEPTGEPELVDKLAQPRQIGIRGRRPSEDGATEEAALGRAVARANTCVPLAS